MLSSAILEESIAMKQYVLIEIESLEKVNVVYMTPSKAEMKRVTNLQGSKGITYDGNLVVVVYDDGEVDGE